MDLTTIPIGFFDFLTVYQATVCELYYITTPESGFFADFGDKISSVLGGILLLNLVEFSILLLPGLLNILLLLLLNHSFSSLN